MSSDSDGEATTVLVVSGDREFTDRCEHNLPNHADVRVWTASTVGEAVDILSRHEQVDCIVSDHNLPDTDGVAFLEVVRARSPALPFILFTSEGSEEFASRAISAGVTEYLIKEHHADQWERLARLVTDTVAYSHDHGDIVNTEARAKTLLDAARDMIAVVSDGSFEYINQTGVELLRAPTRSAVDGRSIEQVLSTDDSDSLAVRFAAVEAGDRPFAQSEERLIRDDGTSLPVTVTASHTPWMGVPAATLVIRDVSERKDYETQLELKDRAMDEAPVGITIADAGEPDNPLIYVNEHFQRITGYSAEEALGENCRFLQGEATDPEPVAEMREAIDADEPVSVELRNYCKDGTEFWNRITIAPVENDAGDVTHYVGFQEDVTERKEYEAELRRFRRAVEAAGHAIYITDPEGTIEYVNPSFEEITGYHREEALGNKPQILHSGEMSADFYEDLWKTISAGEVWEEEIRDRRKSGEMYYASQTIAPVVSGDNGIEGFVAVQTDITAQKERESRLRQYKRAVEGATELIAAVDADYQYLFANPAYREFHGIDTGDVTETTLPETIRDEMFETAESYIEQALAGNPVRYRATRTRPGKPDRTFDIRYYPLENDEGDIQGVVKTMRDLTEQLERETQLATLDRMLRHNLHNELNVILGRAQLIEDQAPEAVAQQAATIDRAADRILDRADKEREIVELLTDISTPVQFDIGETVAKIVDRIEANHPEADITLDGDGTVQLWAIPELERAIEELVENAVVHNDTGAPAVTVSIAADDTSVEVTVTDDGAGIPPSEQKVIGDNASIEPLLHSEGMGLWLVKRIVTRTGGTLSFEEASGRGSTVRVVVPRGGEQATDTESEQVSQDT